MPDEYPKPSERLTKMMTGAQLHHQKLAGDLKDMIELCDAKIAAHHSQNPPDVTEIAKLERIKHSMQLEMDKRRYGGLER